MAKTSDNAFLKPIYKLYYFTYHPDDQVRFDTLRYTDYINNNPVTTTRFLKKPIVVESNPPSAVKQIMEILDEVDELRDSIKPMESNFVFRRTWEYIEFIRVLEKIFFYKNTPEQDVYAEMKFEGKDTNKRKLVIKDDDYEIRFTLEHNVYVNNIMTINVVRDYGLKMQNTYNVVDDNITGTDVSDDCLLDEIKRKLRDSMLDTISLAVKHILEGVGLNEYTIRNATWKDYIT